MDFDYHNHRIYLTRFVKLTVAGLFFLASALLTAPRASHALGRLPYQGSEVVFLPMVVDSNLTGFAKTGGWLPYLNEYRSSAGLSLLAENPDFSSGDEEHARYIVKNDVLAHSEEQGNTWYTDAGHQAAQTSNLMGGSDPLASDYSAIDSWMQAPFHALGILDPALQQVGFGSYREADGGLQMAAGLDVLRGLGDIPAGVAFPVLWPGDGSVVPIGNFWGESPDPLTSCPGYAAPSGLPILLQMGSGGGSPAVQEAYIQQAGVSLEACVFTETTYTHPDPGAQELARAILGERDAVVLIPRTPLASGLEYSVSVTVDGETYAWSFTVLSPSP